jgi:hypothetical protein
MASTNPNASANGNGQKPALPLPTHFTDEGYILDEMVLESRGWARWFCSSRQFSGEGWRRWQLLDHVIGVSLEFIYQLLSVSTILITGR